MIASEMRDRDSGMKAKAKMYADNKRNTKPSDISPGDKVLVQQKRQKELSTPGAPEPHEIATKTGNSVIIEYHPCKEVLGITIAGKDEKTPLPVDITPT